MDVDKDALKLAIEDTRARHSAVVGLIYFTDSQALGLLRLYATLAIATASGAIAAFSVTPVLPKSVGLALGVAAVVLIVGCGLCFRAMETSTINLPGRGAEFWKWATHPKITQGEILAKYLDNLCVRQAANNKINARTASALSHAKRCGVLAPAAALAAGMIALFFGL